MKKKHRSLSKEISQGILIGLALVTTIISILLSLLYFRLSNDHLQCFGTLFPNQKNIEQLAELQFPTSVSNITYEFSETGSHLLGYDCAIWIEFEMYPSDIHELQASTLVIEFTESQIEDKILELRLQSMNIESPHYNLSAEANNGLMYPLVSQWIFIDTSQDEVWTVYVAAIEYMPDF